MKIWTSEHTFTHPWEIVAQSVWKKYPSLTNPVIIGIDVLDRKVIDGVLHTHRLISSKWSFPRWAQPIFGSTRLTYASEHSEVNPITRQMVLKTRNLPFSKYIAVHEIVSYVPHPENNSKTLIRQEAVVTLRRVPIVSYVQDLVSNKISVNLEKRRKALEWVIDRIDAEVKEIANSAAKGANELFTHTKKSFDDITTTTRKSLDDISSAVKKSLDQLQNLNSLPPETYRNFPKIW
jgi:hypothetical protein